MDGKPHTFMPVSLCSVGQAGADRLPALPLAQFKWPAPFKQAIIKQFLISAEECHRSEKGGPAGKLSFMLISLKWFFFFSLMCAVHPLHILKQLYQKEAIKRAACPKPHLCFPAMLGNLRKAISSFHKPSFFEGRYVWNKRCFFSGTASYLRKVLIRQVSFTGQLKSCSRKVCPPPFPHHDISGKGEVLFPWHKSHLCRGSQRMRQLYTSGNVPVGTVTAVHSCFSS